MNKIKKLINRIKELIIVEFLSENDIIFLRLIKDNIINKKDLLNLFSEAELLKELTTYSKLSDKKRINYDRFLNELKAYIDKYKDFNDSKKIVIDLELFEIIKGLETNLYVVFRKNV